MKRLTLVIVAFSLAVVACGDDDAATTLATTTTAAGGVTTTAGSTTTAGGSTSGGETDCREIWTDATVQAVTGEPYSFFAANDDFSACTYMSAINGIALAWRDEDATGFAASRSGATAVSGTEDVNGVCDGAFSTSMGGAIFLMEAYSASQGRAYTATISGTTTADAPGWAAALLAAAC